MKSQSDVKVVFCQTQHNAKQNNDKIHLEVKHETSVFNEHGILVQRNKIWGEPG